MKSAMLIVILLSIPLYANGDLTISTIISSLLINYDHFMRLTEFSCDLQESYSLLKQLANQRTLLRITKVDPVQLYHSTSPNKQLFVMNLGCNNSIQLLGKADHLKYFAFPYKWILFHTTSLNGVLETYFQNLNILVDSDVTLCHLHGNNTITVRKIFKYRAGHRLQTEDVGYWTKDKGYNDFGMEKSMVRRRSDLKGITLNTCIVLTNNDSINHLIDKRDKHIDSIAKVNYVLMEHLASIVNAKFNYTVKNTWGYKVNGSKWSGMIGLLIKKEADIGGTALFLTLDRVDLIDYIAMPTPTGSSFIFREPKLSYVANVYTLPFGRPVWLSTVALVILLGFFIYVIMKWEFKKKNKFEQDPSAAKAHVNLAEVALISFGAVCQQGATTIPTSVPGRIATIILFISLMFLYTSYAANIVALLQSSSSSIQTLDDLLNSRIKVGVHDTVFNRFYFPNAQEPVRKALYEQKIAPPGRKPQYMSLLEGVLRIREGLFAFHMETGVGYKLIGEIFHEHEKCGLRGIQFLNVIRDPWLAIQKNSSYKKLLKIGLRKIHESGIQKRENNLIYTKKPQCASRGSTFINVGLVDCYSAAVVLTVGIIASLVIWIIETITYKRLKMKGRFMRRQKHKRKWNS